MHIALVVMSWIFGPVGESFLPIIMAVAIIAVTGVIRSAVSRWRASRRPPWQM